ncbi:MAG: adenylate/guanylate cyclase domain-containing protein, partial [Verrucomicrobiota bacterium]
MIKFLIKHARWIVVGIGLFFFGLVQTPWLTESNLWQKANGALADRRYLLRGPRPPRPEIQLIGIQGSSLSLDTLAPEEIAASPALQLMQQPWPWDRRVYAAVLEKLMDAGAKVVVFDFVFAGATEGDEVFAAALEKYKDRVVIGSMFRQESGEQQEKYIPPNSRLLLPGTESVVGLVNLWPDPDGIVRSVRYRTSVAREYERVFKKGMLLNEPDDLTHLTLSAVQKYGAKVTVPNEVAYIDFQGPRETYPMLPIENMFVDKLWQAPPFAAGQLFRNKIVVVGPIAEIFHDTHDTPFGNTPGPEVQAQLMGALLLQSFIHPTPWATDLALEFSMVALALAICLRVGNALLKVFLMVVVTVLFLVICQLLFNQVNLLVNILSPLFCLVATGSYGVTFLFAIEQFERLRTRNLLERYVSKNVAKTILEDQRSFLESLNGRKQNVAVLFSDIRGFTSMTEGSEPEKLVAQLNEYFLQMVGAVLDEGGTLQKFIGDAIMAAWGDTHSEGAAEDARRSVRAALKMRQELAKLNERWLTQPDRTKLSIGIGVNHGEIIVGNIGHPQRMEFTVLGDGVNLAARLESATKQFHTDILVGATLEALTREHFVYRRVDLLTVKGKARPVEVFTLLSDASQPPPAWLAEYHEAIRLYRGREFEPAAEKFRQVEKDAG